MQLETIIKKPTVKYSDLDHSYTHLLDNRPYASISKVVERLPKDYLVPWATKMNFEYMLVHWDLARRYTRQEQLDLLAKARYAYKTEQDEATGIGRVIHNWIEQHIKGIDKPIPKDIERPINLFLEWEKWNIEEWLASEMIVSSDALEVAGRLDAVGILKNISTNSFITAGDSPLTALVDFKTSNAINRSYNIQTAGYWICLNEMGFSTNYRVILRLPKTETHKVYNSNTGRYSTEANNLETKIIEDGLSDDINIFKSLRAVHRWVEEK